MEDKFFFFTANQKKPKANPTEDASTMTTLLSGPPCSGKTSLLFQYALNINAQSDNKVMFICNKKRLENKPPLYQSHHHPTQNLLESIHMKYIEDDADLKKYFAAFHLHNLNEIPSAVVIDDFSDYFDGKGCRDRYGSTRGREIAMVRALALCRDAVTFASGRGRRCELVVGDTHQGDFPRLLFVFRRWMQRVFMIRRGGGSNSFVLSVVGSELGMKKAKYCVGMDCLMVEEISEGE